MSFASPHPAVDIPDLSLYDYLFADLGGRDDQLATIDGLSGASVTYRQLREQIDALAGALAALGVQPHQVVGILAPNLPAYVTVFHGILRAGATATTINALYTAHEIAAQLANSQATHLFTLSMFLPAALAAATEVGLPAENILLIDSPENSEHPTLWALIEGGHPAPEVSIEPATHLAVLPYSSGTTGQAKGVMLTHRNLVANIAQSAPCVGLRSTDRILCVLPFFHIYGMNVLMNGGLHFKATLVTMPRFDLAQFLKVIADHRTTYIFVAPPIAVALAKHPMVDDFDTTSVRMMFSGAAPLDAGLGAAVERRIGCQMRQGYGMTEMSPVSHTIPQDRDDISLDTVGLTVPNMECRLVDPITGQEIGIPSEGTSQPGELWCKGPNVMVGYLGDDAATEAMLEPDGWLHTGDVATVSAEGYVRIVDRVKELIKYKGYQVPPAELEALLLTHADIADAAVIGVLDEETGEEIPKAFVVTQPGSSLVAGEVMSFVAERVAPHKKVRAVEFVASIPKSTSGKILRKDLRRPAATTAAAKPALSS